MIAIKPNLDTLEDEWYIFRYIYKYTNIYLTLEFEG